MGTDRRKKQTRNTSTLIAVASVALGSSAAFAQQSGSPADATGLEEVTVTARKTRESIINAPVTVTAITAESLLSRGIEDRRDLNRFTPGFKAQPQNTSGATRLINTYGMRGLGTVNLFWNGVPLNGGDIPELLDLERVEVLKGPQTAYFGRSTFSGAINFVPKQASEQFGGSVDIDVGGYNNRNFKGSINGSIVEGKLFGRIAASYHQTGEQYDNYGYGGKLGRQETSAATASITFQPADGFKANLYLASWRENDGPNAISYLQSTDYTCNAGAAPTNVLNYYCGEISRSRPDRISQLPVFPASAIEQVTAVTTTNTIPKDFITGNGMKRRGNLGQLFLDYDLPFGLTAAISLSKFKNEAGQIFDYANRFYTDSKTYNPSMTAYLFDDQYAELRITSNPESTIRGMLGVSYVDSAQTIQSAISKSGVLSVSFVPTILYSRTLGIFGSLSYNLTEKLKATVEGRYQEDTVGRNTINVSNLAGNTYSFTPRAIMEYQIRPSLNAFFSYSEGSRPGALNTGFLALPAYAQQQVATNYSVPRVVPEERLKNYEIGVKGDFLENRLRILAGIYKAKWVDRQIAAALFYTNTAGVLAQANVTLGAGAVDAKGAELEMQWVPTNNLTFDATAAYNWTSIISTNCAACRAITGSAFPTGTKFARFPVTSASIGATYKTQRLFSDLDGYARVDANYQGREYADETNVVWLSPYVMSNIRLGLQNEKYRSELYILNAFDNQVPQAIAQTTDQITGKNTLTTTPPLKRTVGIRFGIKF